LTSQIGCAESSDYINGRRHARSVAQSLFYRIGQWLSEHRGCGATDRRGQLNAVCVCCGNQLGKGHACVERETLEAISSWP
jgi:hypothetical protein